MRQKRDKWDRAGAKLDRGKLIARAVMSGCPAIISITVSYFPDLQERAAIKEFDGKIPRLDAELSTLLDEISINSKDERR